MFALYFILNIYSLNPADILNIYVLNPADILNIYLLNPADIHLLIGHAL